MSFKINIPTLDGMSKLVRAAERNRANVLVSKEGFSWTVDCASMVAMMALISSNIVVKCEECSEELLSIVSKYRI